MMGVPLPLAISFGIMASLGSLAAIAALVLAILNRAAVDGSKDGDADSRLKVMEEWKRSRSVDRSEHEEHGRRIVELERQVGNLVELMAGLRVEFARLSGAIELQGKTLELKMEQVGHDVKNIKAALPALSPRLRE